MQNGICVSDSSLDGTSTISKASEIPPELFERIIHHVVRGRLQDDEKEWRAAISAVSLTCRWWAQKSRQYVFQRLTLRSRDDVHFLEEVLKRTPFPFEDGNPAEQGIEDLRVIQRVEVVQDTEKLAWIHLGPFFIPKLSHLQTLAYVYEGPDDFKRAYNVHHPYFPKRLPSLLRTSNNVTTIEVSEIEFASFMDMVRIMHACPSIVDVSLYDVTWKGNSSLIVPFCSSRSLRNLYVWGPGKMWMAFKAFLARSKYRPATLPGSQRLVMPLPILTDHDFTSATELIKELCASKLPREPTIHCHYRPQDNCPSFSAYPQLYVAVVFAIADNSHSDDLHSVNGVEMQLIVLDQEGSTKKPALDVDWTAVGKLLAKFTQLHYIKIRLSTRRSAEGVVTSDDVAAFETTFHAGLPEAIAGREGMLIEISALNLTQLIYREHRYLLQDEKKSRQKGYEYLACALLRNRGF